MAVFPKVDSPLRARGLRQPPGLSPLGCQGSACERLRLTGSLRAPPRELYSTALCVSRMGYASQPKLASSLPNKRPSFYSDDRLGRWATCGANINAAFRRRPPLVAGATTFLLKGSMSLDSQSPTAPYESSSFATPQAGAQQPVLKLEQLMRYQACGALLSTVHILHRMCKSGEVRRLACP